MAEQSNPSSGAEIYDTGMISHLEVDRRDNDNDSSLGIDAASTSTGISAAALNYRYENGRRYHAYEDGTYHLPNDEREMDRLELQHLIWSAAFNGRLFLCPLQYNITDALDIGCGTGAWAIEFADAYPNCQIIGTDLSPIQPHTVPINCSFQIDDATKDWTFIKSFDFIHTRAITMGIRSWDRLIDQANSFLKPGAWLELQEFHLPLGCDDGSMAKDSPLEAWGQEVHRACAKVGIDSLASLEHGKRLKERGFVDVGTRQLKIPLGPWAKGKKEKKIGFMAQKDLFDGMEGISSKLLTLLGYEKDKLDAFLENARYDLMNSDFHTYISIDVTWGQKPL